MFAPCLPWLKLRFLQANIALVSFQVSPYAVHAVCTSKPDTSPYILTAGSDRRIRLWDLAYPEHSQMVVGAATDNLTNVVLQYKYDTFIACMFGLSLIFHPIKITHLLLRSV